MTAALATPSSELLAILTREHKKAHREAVKHNRYCIGSCATGGLCAAGADLNDAADQLRREITTAERGWPA